MDVKICTWLLEDTLDLKADFKVAVCFAEDLKFLYYLAASLRRVDVFDLHHSQLQRARARLDDLADDALHLHDAVFPPESGDYDVVVMLAPKGRDLGQAHIWRAWGALKPGGSLYIAGATKEGAKSVIADAEALFGHAVTLIYKRSHRVARCDKAPGSTRQRPASWEDVPPAEPHDRTYHTPQGDLPVQTMPGVFSWESLDKGTAYLLETVDFKTLAGARVLDMGCGVGVLGALAARHAEHVTLVDDNLLAVQCTQGTLARNGIDNAQALVSDGYEALAGQGFDVILCNPPFHREFDVNTNVALRVIRESPAHLREEGQLLLVANAFLKYEREADAHFRYVRTREQTNRFKVIECRVS
jgi:16S rRNA (guanine1207-N2)-methyltransferase